MKEKIAGLSVLANLILAGGKIFAGILAKSASVLAEGLHSSMDVLSSIISLVGIKISKKPVDKKHPYGYYKFEVLSGLFITFILFITGAGITYNAIKNFLNPSKIIFTYFTLGIMILSAIINEAMARLKIYYGKKESSISLLSDGIHSRVDVWASLIVLAGLFLTKFWIYADSFLAFLIGLYIIKESFSLGKEATDSLLDVSAGEEVEKKIRKIVKENKLHLNNLKTLKKGSAITANLEIKVPNKISVEEATKKSRKLKKELIRKIENLKYVAIQIKSLKVTDSYFEPEFGQGFGWQRRGKFKDKIKKAKGKGPEGYCICPKCGYKQKHEKGIPCSTIKCPKCGVYLERE